MVSLKACQNRAKLTRELRFFKIILEALLLRLPKIRFFSPHLRYLGKFKPAHNTHVTFNGNLHEYTQTHKQSVTVILDSLTLEGEAK